LVGWRYLGDPKVGVVALFFAVLTDLSYKWLLCAVILPLVLFASLLGALLSVPFPGGKRVDVPLGGLCCRLFRLIVGSLRSATGEVPIYRCIYAEVVGFGRQALVSHTVQVWLLCGRGVPEVHYASARPKNLLRRRRPGSLLQFICVGLY